MLDRRAQTSQMYAWDGIVEKHSVSHNDYCRRAECNIVISIKNLYPVLRKHVFD